MLQTLRDDSRGRFADGLPFCHSILSWLAPQAPRGKPLVYTTDKGMPVFTAIPVKNQAGADAIAKQVGNARPAFVVAWCGCWELKGDDLVTTFSKKSADMTLVSPAQLAQLYREARKEGWVK